MSVKTKINASELILITVGSALMYPFTILPVLNSPPANQDVWISALVSIIYIILISVPSLVLINKFRGLNINQTAEIISGKIFGKVFLFMFVLFSMFCYVACSITMLVFVRTYLLEKTPDWAILLALSVPVLYGAYKGAGTIGKISLFIVPLMLSIALFYFVIAIPNIKLDAIKPVLADSELLDINLGAFLSAARYSDILEFFVFSYYLVKKSSINKTFFTNLIIFGITYFIIVFPTITVLGPLIAKEQMSPYFVFTRQLETYDFLRRLQSLNILVWFPGAIFKIMLHAYMIGFIFKNMFKTKTHKPFIAGIVILAFFIIILGMPDSASAIQYLKSDALFPYVVFFIAFVVPLTLVIIYLCRKKTVDKEFEKMKKEEERIGGDEGQESEEESGEKNKEKESQSGDNDNNEQSGKKGENKGKQYAFEGKEQRQNFEDKKHKSYLFDSPEDDKKPKKILKKANTKINGRMNSTG
jgi:spore germination protein KB